MVRGPRKSKNEIARFQALGHRNPAISNRPTDENRLQFNRLAVVHGRLFSVNSLADSFVVPTIAANSTYILMPGISNDGNGHPLNGLFATIGGTQDTSDGQGGVSDGSIFSFTGLAGLLAVTSNTPGDLPGTFSPGNPALILPARDLPTWFVSFVGFGPNGDGGCFNCYFGRVATLDVPDASTTPLPAALPLFATGLGALGLLGWRRKRKAAALAA